MRKIIITAVVLLVLIAAIGFFLVATTPRQSVDFHARLNLLSNVPASAESFAIIPTAAAVDAKLQANPVTRAAVEKWRANQRLPRAWMVGNADLVAWKSGDTIRYFLRLDPFRAFIVRIFGHGEIVSPPGGEEPLDSQTVRQVTELASRLPNGNALVVQRENSRGAYPPMSRPAVTAVSVTPAEVVMTSVASAVPAPAEPPATAAPALSFPQSAMLTVAFTSPPRVIHDLDRLFGVKISTLFDSGGTLCIYDVDLKKLLPRPLGVIALPDDPARRAVVDSFRQAEAAGIHVRTAEKSGMLLLSFDDSIGLYQNDVFAPPATAGNQWTLRIDPARLVPILNDLGQNLGLRIATPRVFRSARDLDRWIGGLEQAKVIEASDSADSAGETIRVRIAAK